MTKSTLSFTVVAALGLGTLVGVGLADDVPDEKADDHGQNASQADVPEATAGQGLPDAADLGGAPVFRYFSDTDVTVEFDDFDRPIPTLDGENFIERQRGIQSETVVVTLARDQGIEYKAIMAQGDGLTFHWQSDDAQIYYDFHGHDDAFGPDFFTRYREGEGTSHAGSMVAPYAGQHGWYWLNLEPRSVTITLQVAGFYDEIIKVDMETGEE